jgi:hypothetical protein
MHANHLMRKQSVCPHDHDCAFCNPRDQNCCAPTTLMLRLLLDVDVFLLITPIGIREANVSLSQVEVQESVIGMSRRKHHIQR